MFYLLFLLFALGQLGRISFYNQLVNIYLYEIVMTTYLSWLIYNYRFVAAVSKLYKSIFIFCGVLLLSFIIGINKFSLLDNLVGASYLVRLILYFLFFFYLIHHVEFSKLKRPFRVGIGIFIIITAITSFIQYFLYPDLRNLYYLGWDPHLYRAFGVFFDTSIAAAVYGMILLWLISFKYQNSSIRQVSSFKVFKWPLATCYVILGLLTYSRGFYISIVITLVYLIVQKKLYKWIVVLIVGFILALVVIPKPYGEGVNLKRVFTIESRLADDKKAILVWQENPIFGIGYNRIGAIKNGTPSHAAASFPSSFLIILSTTGILGLIAFSMMLKNLAMISNTSKLYVLFLSIFSLFDNIFLHPFILFLLVFFIFDS